MMSNQTDQTELPELAKSLSRPLTEILLPDTGRAVSPSLPVCVSPGRRLFAQGVQQLPVVTVHCLLLLLIIVHTQELQSSRASCELGKEKARKDSLSETIGRQTLLVSESVSGKVGREKEVCLSVKW